jgi:hypothetical protein
MRQTSHCHEVVALIDPELFRCGFAMISEPGGVYLSRVEAEALQDICERGFLRSDSAEPHFRRISDQGSGDRDDNNTDFSDA